MAAITPPRADKDLLMAMDSFAMSPLVCDCTPLFTHHSGVAGGKIVRIRMKEGGENGQWDVEAGHLSKLLGAGQINQ